MASLEPASAESEPDYWWYARFKLPWPEDQREPDFSKHLMIAHEVLAPLIDRYSAQLKLWRIHRRAARDAAGHQFSFIFYASVDDARTVLSAIRDDQRVPKLIADGVLLKVLLDDPDRPTKPGIAATSDPHWPPEIQRSWPYFIMGVSVMWMDLVEQEIDPAVLTMRTTRAARASYYRRINDRITDLWTEKGRHAFLHHLSAVFGYEPVDIRF